MEPTLEYQDDFQEEAEDYESQSQQETQSTQEASQNTIPDIDTESLWGYLQPCSADLFRLEFNHLQKTYTIGRNDKNLYVLPGVKVSNEHCKISWLDNSVVIEDLSSNGTFINGHKIGRGNKRVLVDGNEVAFGTPVAQPLTSHEDYRYIYRHTADLHTGGLYAEYDLSHELGRGAFATVVKGMSRATGEWVAVKMIHANKNQNEIERATQNAMFAREINIMQTLKHPNICEMKNVFFQTNGDINLVLELVEGGDLLEYILEREGVAEPEAKHITYQLCDALSYIHSKGILHRDLKPENILLTRDNPPQVKVADFGLAKLVNNLTIAKTMCGTPSYLAPEVVLQVNQEGYDNLVDSWSVGTIVFAMLTNVAPFNEDRTQQDIRIRIANRTIEWSALEERDLSFNAKDFVFALMQTDPRRRMTMTNSLHHDWLRSYVQPY